jgi:uncharacterized membrane protein YvlD (DUF360 family)
MIKIISRSYIVNVFALWFTSTQITSFILANGWQSLLMVALGFTLLHILIKPIANMVLGGINFLTLGLIGLLVDAIILYVLTLYLPQVSIGAWDFPGYIYNGFVIPSYSFGQIGTTIISAFFINIIRTLADLLV